MALVVFAQLPHSTQLMHVIHKTGHPLVFGLVALIAARLMSLRLGMEQLHVGHYLAALAIAVSLGALTEIAQVPLARGASLVDVLRDLIGAGAALSFLWVWKNRGKARRVHGARVAGVLLLAVSLIALAVGPMAWCVAAYINRDARLPVLAGFTSPLDTYFLSDDRAAVYGMRMPREWAQAPGEHAFRVLPKDMSAAGFHMIEPHPDWRGYRVLAVDLTNPGDLPLRVFVRVHDVTHNWETRDRFNRTIDVPARTRLTTRFTLEEVRSAPRGRHMDLQRIAGLAVFAARRSKQREFLLSRIVLEER
jgi:VanZ family protein